MKYSFWFIILGFLVFTGCNNAEQRGSVNFVREFINDFDERALPFNLEDTSLYKKDVDSLKLDPAQFYTYVPDSIFRPLFGKKQRPVIFPIGRISVRSLETYVLFKAVSPQRKAAYVAVFNHLDSFVAAMPLINGDKMANTGFSASIDKRYTITKTKLKREPSGQIIYSKDAFIFNKEDSFTLILTESNDVAQIRAEVVNPLDTFPATSALAGDYVQDKNNFVAVRDGAASNQIEIFIHFQKNNGTCKGELKGTATMISENHARYTQAGDPCVLELFFDNQHVTLKETKGCGAYRGVKCFFEGKYRKKKQ